MTECRGRSRTSGRDGPKHVTALRWYEEERCVTRIFRGEKTGQFEENRRLKSSRKEHLLKDSGVCTV